MNKQTPHKAIIAQKVSLNNDFLRVCIKPSQEDFNSMELGTNVKFIVNQEKKAVRTYTISDKSEDCIFLDVVNHHNEGLASQLFKNANVGDEIIINGFMPMSEINMNANTIIYGDKTAFATIKNLLRKKESINKVIIFIKASEATVHNYFKDFESLINVEFIISEDFTELKDSIYTYLNSFNKAISFWATGERIEINEIRKIIKKISPEILKSKFTSSYWQFQLNAEEHRLLKKADLNNG
jgi:NADPH-dependent ferric siderophore reductase